MRRLSVQFLAVLAALALLGMALAGLASAAEPPRLSVTVSTRSPKQGAVVALAIRSDRALLALSVRQGDTTIPVELTDGGTLGLALVGLDMDARVGDLVLRLEATPADGRTVPVTYALDVVSGEFRVQRLSVSRGYVELPPAVQDQVRADQAAVAHVWATGEPVRRWLGPFRRPVEGEPSDNFGVRRVFNGQPRAPHNGVDFGAPEGAPVIAPAEARVALAHSLYFSGGTIILDHGAGLHTTYFHLSRIDVARGDVVGPGDPIGAVGSTGRSTGPHLHWGARLHGARVNPLYLLELHDWPRDAGVAKPAIPTVPSVPAAATPAAAPAATPVGQ